MSSSLDYDSDEYHDEQGRRVYEAEFPTRPQYVVREVDGGGSMMVPNALCCKNSGQEPEVMEEVIKTEIKSEEPSSEDEDDEFPEEPMEEVQQKTQGLQNQQQKQAKKEGYWQDRKKVREPVPNAPKPFTPRFGYTLAEMTPTVRDPLCKSKKPELACLWPVYVDNFWCENRSDEFGCVKKYFAWKGLHVRWWYRKTDDQYYREFQSRAGIFDMLVYFVSEQDANLAIQQCHRDCYLGYTLNVFPGRVPVYFDRNLTVRATKMKSGKVYSEHFFEQHIKRLSPIPVDVKCTVKFDSKNGAIEFANLKHKQAAQSRIRLFKLEDVKEDQLRKQRFLEHDLLTEIEAHLSVNPAALKLDHEHKFVKMLLMGSRPAVDPYPKLPIVPLRSGPTKLAQQGNFRRKLKKMDKQIQRDLAAGRDPKCYDKRHKKKFHKMVEKALPGVF